MKRLIVTLLVLMVVLSVFVTKNVCRAQEIKVVVTARCIFDGIILAQKEFEKESGITLNINTTCAGLNKGVEAVINGTADIGTLGRELSNQEKKAGAVATLIGKDGIAIIVNKNNTVDNLSFKDVRNIFLGKVTNWKEVGGEDKKIIIMRCLCGTSEIGVFEDILYKGEKPDQELKVMESKIGDVVIEKLAKYATGIAALSPLFKTDETKTLKVDGVLPIRSNVKDGSYPLARPLYLVTKGEPTGNLKKFVSFMLSEKGQGIVDKGLKLDWLNEGF